MVPGSEYLRNKIKQFYLMLNNYPDHPGSTTNFVNYFRGFLRVKDKNTLPTIELMTLLKKHKPSVYSEIRKMGKDNIMLGILSELSMDIEEAEQRLKKLIY